MSKITRHSKCDGEMYGENVFDISRPNIFGNPYTHIKNRETKALVKVSTRDEAIRLYSFYFDRMLALDGDEGDRFRAEWDRMYDAYKKYDEIFLSCYCKLTESCHADVIRKKLIQRSMKEKIDGIKSDDVGREKRVFGQ